MRDASAGSDANVVSDGWWNVIRTKRASIPGLVGWDLSFLWMGLVAMDAPQAEIDWVYESLLDLGADMLALDAGTEYVTLSLAHLTVVYARNQAVEPIAEEVLEELLSYDDGPGYYGDYQATAYACMAFAEAGLDAEHLQSSDLLRGQIDALGRIIEPDGYVYFETEGEVLQALLH